MEIGVVFPQTEFGNNPEAIKDYAQAVEGLGFTHVLAYEHVLGANPDRPGGWRGPYTHEDPFHEPFLLFSFMAAVTSTLGFVTGILILPQRETALVAKQAASLDVLSSGRFRLGLGVGWNKVEFIALNQDFHARGVRMDEQLEVLQQLFTEPLVNFSGRQHTIPDAGLNPMPVQQPIPIWFGGHADAVIERIARLGNGWLPGYREAADAAPWLERLDQALERHGRTRADIGIEPRLVYKQGSPESWNRTLSAWEAAGATHASINTMGCGFEHPAEHINALETFARAVGLAG
jgi:probable F420-dependent oxidoreductase